MMNLDEQVTMPPGKSTRIKLTPEQRKQRSNARRSAGMSCKRGRTEKRSCFVCNSQKRLEFHHPDYCHALDVICLCHLHHQMITHGYLSLIPDAVKDYLKFQRVVYALNYKAQMEKIIRDALKKVGPVPQ